MAQAGGGAIAESDGATVTAFVAGLIYRAALEAQHCGTMSWLYDVIYPLGQDDAFKTLLRVMGYR